MKKAGLVFLMVVLIVLVGRLTPYSESATTIPFDEKYSDSSAIFLLYSLDLKVNSDWSYVTNVHKKVKILKDDAQDMGEMPIFYENDRENIVDLSAFTVAPDNTIYQYSKMQDMNIYEGYPMYSDSKVKVITLPQVTVGSILEQKYSIHSKGLPIKNAFWCQEYVDSNTPIKNLRVSITIPKSLGIQYKEFGLSRKPKISQDKETITYSWDVKDIEPAEDREGYLPPPTPQSIREGVEFSSIKSWPEISDWYSSLMKKNIKITPEIEKAVAKITKDKTTVKDKTRAILEYIQKDFRYVSMSFGDNTLEPHPTDEVFRNKYGDCKDLSLLCKTMLSIAGINANLCLFNTEYSLSDPKHDLPIPSLFDHVFLIVEDPKGESFYVDPLLKGYDIGEFPVSYQGGYLFEINDSGGKFAKFPIFDEKRNYTSSIRTVTIGEDGSALIEADATWDLDFSVEQREKLNSLTKKQKDQFYEGLDAYIASGGQMIKRDIIGLDQKYGIMKASNKMKLTEAYPITDGLMIIDINGFDRGLDFTKKDRVNPIFYPLNSMNEEITTYKLPKGYVASYVPPNLDLDNGFFSIKRDYIKGDGEIKVVEVARYKRTEVANKEYEKIRGFYDKLPTATQQRIIIKKQNSAS